MAEAPNPTPQRPAQDDATVGWAVFTSLIAGIAGWGGVGWLIGLWLHTPVALLVGMLVGFASSIYLIVKKYG